MPAFELALQEEPQWVELDVRQTKDGVIVVSHDDDLSRVARQKLYVHELTYSELLTYDVGSWFREEFSDVRLSTLDEVLKLCKDNIPLQIEIKPSGYDVDLEEHVLQVVYENDMQDQVMITCLKPGPLKRIKELAPTIPTAYSMFFAWGHIEDMEFSDYFTIEEGNVTKTLVDNVHKAGRKLRLDGEQRRKCAVSGGLRRGRHSNRRPHHASGYPGQGGLFRRLCQGRPLHHQLDRAGRLRPGAGVLMPSKKGAPRNEKIRGAPVLL